MRASVTVRRHRHSTNQVARWKPIHYTRQAFIDQRRFAGTGGLLPGRSTN